MRKTIKAIQGGYIALFSTIVLVALFLLLFTGIFLIAVGGMDRISDKESDIRASSLASICIEEGLNMIRKDPESPLEDFACIKDTEEEGYGEEDTITCEEGGVVENKDAFCEIKNVQHVGGDMIFISEGVYFDYSTAIEIEVIIKESEGERTLKIHRWDEDVST